MIISKIEIIDSDILVRYAGDEFILFSDRENALKTNADVSVGVSEVVDCDIILAINVADVNMIKSKEESKD